METVLCGWICTIRFKVDVSGNLQLNHRVNVLYLYFNQLPLRVCGCGTEKVQKLKALEVQKVRGTSKEKANFCSLLIV